MNTVVRAARPADAGCIVDFNRRLAEESEARQLEPDIVAAGVRAVFSNPEHGRYYVAERDGRVVGQLLVTHEWSDWRNGLFWWIQSAYVAPDARRFGVFSSLYRHIRDLARGDPGVCGLRLYVETENEQAQQTYSSLGMSNTGYRVMEMTLESNDA